MPPSPIKPMNNPWPIHSGQAGPKVEIERPRPIDKEPKITVQRVPTRSAIRAMMMPPVPEPSHASALASAGTERDPPTSLAMSLSATTVIQAAPNDIPRMKSATEATAQEALVSTEPEGDCNIRRELGWRIPFTACTEFHHPHPRRVCSTCCIAPMVSDWTGRYAGGYSSGSRLCHSGVAEQHIDQAGSRDQCGTEKKDFLLRAPTTTGTARRLATVMRSLNFIPIKSRRLMPGGRAGNTVTRGWARPIHELKSSSAICRPSVKRYHDERVER